MTSTVSPVGSDPTHDADRHGSAPPVAPERKSRIRRIAEEEHILVVLLAGFALIFLLIFPPALLVNDSWLNLAMGREVVQNGLPSHDELTVYGLGSVWTDQQWLAQVFMYGVYSLGGFALLSIMACAFVIGAFTLAAAASRSLGAGPRAIWLLFLPVLISAALGWSIRAQMVTLPLYTGLLWLLASEARRPTRRVWIALPMLVLWASMHGSAALGALLVMLLGAYELALSRGSSWKRSIPLVLAAPLAILVTPYGPVTTAQYYRLMMVDPPFAGHVTEWSWPAPASNTYAFYVLAAMAIPLVIWGRKRLTAFDIGVLVLTLAGALTAIRGIPWFAFACMVFVPVAIGRSLESRKPGEPRRGLNLAISIGLATGVLLSAGALFTRSDSSFESFWPRAGAVEAIRANLRPGDRVFAPDVYSDWVLWKIPELRGRIAYDVRFEIYDRDFFDRLANYNWEHGDWKSFANGYRIVLVDENIRSHTSDFLKEPGTRVIYRDDDLTVIARPAH